jgi:subtilase family serine protease
VRCLAYIGMLIIPAVLTVMPNLNNAAKAAGAAGANRASNRGRVRLPPGRAPVLTGQSTYLGPMPPDELLHMTAAFEAQDPAGLRDTISDLYNPASRFHQWLSPEEFGHMFGRSAGEIQQEGWLSAQGFKIDETWANNLAITSSGRVADAERAFSLNIGRYHNAAQDRVFFSNEADAVLPPELSGITLELRGLDNAYRYQTGKTRVQGTVTDQEIKRKISGAKRRSTGTDALISGHFFMGPADLQLAYDITGPNGEPITNPGLGQVAAIIIDSDLSASDINNYRKVVGLPPANVKRFAVPGLKKARVDDDLEAALDYAAVSAIGPRAEIALVLPPDLTYANVFAAEQYVVNKLMPPVVNESFSGCEGDSFSMAEQTLFDQAVTEGIAFVASTGDDGLQCDTNDFESGLAMVGCPACYSAVTAAGGTQYTASVRDSSGNLVGVSNEVVWNTPPGVRGDCLGDPTTGASLEFSSYLGGSGSDNCTSLAVDSGGNIYVAGSTLSPDFPVVNAFQSALEETRADESDPDPNGFLTKISPSSAASEDYSRPVITQAAIGGQVLTVTGLHIQPGAIMAVNGVKVATVANSAGPGVLIAKKGAKTIKPSYTANIQVINSTRSISDPYSLSRP